MREADEAGPSGPLTLLLSCPECGAPKAVDDDARSSVCDHCGSFLVVARPGRDQIFLAESQVKGSDDVRAILVAYRLQARRAELILRYSTDGGDGVRVPPPEGMLAVELSAYEGMLAQRLRITEAHRIEAPYWHLSGTILQAILGRRHEGPKEIRIRAFAAEHTAPAYDVRAANLRDRGLRLARSRVHPLSRRALGDRGPFIPWTPVSPVAHKDVERWRTRDLDPGFEPVVKRGDLVFARQCLVYRPYWLARVLSDQEQAWVLVDAGFGTIAGHPSEMEARALLGMGVADPEDTASRDTRAVVRPSRCPDCGFDVTFDARSVAIFCPNCQLALELTAEGARLLAYDHAEVVTAGTSPEALPFWTFPARVTVPGSPTSEGLETYAAALYPKGLPPGFAPRGGRLFVPAFRLLGTEAGDECFRRLVEWIHHDPPEVVDGKLPLGGKPTLRGVVVSESEAREALPAVLYALHDKTSASRLNTLLVRKAIDAARVAPTPGRLVLVPFAKGPDGAEVPGADVHVARLLLDGGPELEAQRATVQASVVTET
jgi:ribosomal protein S27E